MSLTTTEAAADDVGIASMPPIFTVDMEGQICGWNKSMQRLIRHGTTNNRNLVEDWMKPDSFVNFQKTLKRVASTDDSSTYCDVEFRVQPALQSELSSSRNSNNKTKLCHRQRRRLLLSRNVSPDETVLGAICLVTDIIIPTPTTKTTTIPNGDHVIPRKVDADDDNGRRSMLSGNRSIDEESTDERPEEAALVLENGINDLPSLPALVIIDHEDDLQILQSNTALYDLLGCKEEKDISSIYSFVLEMDQFTKAVRRCGCCCRTTAHNAVAPKDVVAEEGRQPQPPEEVFMHLLHQKKKDGTTAAAALPPTTIGARAVFRRARTTTTTAQRTQTTHDDDDDSSQKINCDCNCNTNRGCGVVLVTFFPCNNNNDEVLLDGGDSDQHLSWQTTATKNNDSSHRVMTLECDEVDVVGNRPLRSRTNDAVQRVDESVLLSSGSTSGITDDGRPAITNGAWTLPQLLDDELQQILETAPIPIFGIDLDGKVNEYWNKTMVEITGFLQQEAIGVPLVETFVLPRYHTVLEDAIQNAIMDGQGTSNLDVAFRTKEGDTRYFLVALTPRRNRDDGCIMGVLCLAQDVTESSEHNRAVAAIATELRGLMDTANAPVIGIDSDGNVNEWNDKTAEITGYTKEEAVDRSLVDTFILPHLRVPVEEMLCNAMEGCGTSNFELEIRTKSRDVRYLLVNTTTRRDAGGNIVGVVCVAQDVTEAVQRDSAVAGIALELRQLIDTANAPIFGIDIDGNINEWNHRTQEITGYSKEETFGEPLVESFIATHMQQKVREILQSALHGNETSNYELEFVSKSGEPCFMVVNATTRRDPDGHVVGVVGVAQDVTEDRKHEAEIRKMHSVQAAQEAKVETERNMTAYFAHELRNPLSAIDSALIAMPDNLPETAKSLVEGMQRCSQFMATIMNNLLDVRKMEEGKLTLNKIPLSLNKLLAGVQSMLQPSLKPTVGFYMECNTDGRDWVLGDQHRIQQIFTNVITNSIKYTVAGRVTISIGWEGENVQFKCIDTGPGIPKLEQQKLFQRFVQRGGAPGTGLGLAIAKHLVDLAGGSISFDSDPALKAGTTCIVNLPLPLCPSPDAEADGDDETHKVLNAPVSFLIIDDIKMNRMMLKRRIQKGICPSCRIGEAPTGEHALEICGKDHYDVIIVDQYMEEAGGVMLGTDVIYAMRRMRIDSIIIGCSGNDLEAEFGEAGADWVWKKPMPSNQEIIAHLRGALASKYEDL